MDIFKDQNTWLVTGGAGFIGSHLVEDLISYNQKVVCIDDFSSGFEKNLKNNVFLDVVDNKVQNINFKNFGVKFKGIFHLAAQASAPKSIDDFFLSSSNNLTSSLKVMQIAKELKVPLVYASSSAVYGNLPIGNDGKSDFNILSPYAMDKITMENYANLAKKLFNTTSIGLRFFNVYGPRQDPSNPYSGVISKFIHNLILNKEVRLNGGNQTRDFIYVKDVSQVLINSMALCSKKVVSNIYNVGTGNSITIKHLLSIISDILKIQPKIIKKELPKGDPELSNCVIAKLENEIGVDVNKFYSLQEGIELTVKYWYNNYKI